MRALDEGRARITDSFSEHMFRCLDCRACETACPAGVHFGQMLEDTRADIVSKRPAHWIARLMLKHVFPYRWRFHLASRLLQIYQLTGLQKFVRATGLVGLFGPGMAKSEALMPDLPIEAGIELGKTYPAEGERVGTV